jgi:molecular chaperone DnaK
MKPIVGIDLGTTYSALAILDESGKPSLVSADGERILPSCVWADPKEPTTLRVGAIAKNSLGTSPQEVAARFKRHMGSDHKLHVTLHGRNATPVEASAHVIKKLIQEAEKSHPKIEEIVITVPANFAERQRRATIEAGELAGVKVLNIINEPTAAALAYATQHDISGNILVYDMGGGTFDVTIARVAGTNVESLASEGDIDLGGIDFDRRLAGLVDKIYEKTHDTTLRADLGITTPEDEIKSSEWQALLLECEKWKKELSVRDSVTVRFYEGPKGKVQGEITRSDFESAISTYIAKAEMLVETALENAGVSPGDIDSILLVGGSTRIPAVRKSINGLIGKKPLESVNPDEAVALGAAIYSGLNSKTRLTPVQKRRLEKIAVEDIANHFFGTVCLAHEENLNETVLKVDILIPKGKKLPCSETRVYRTVNDGQQFIRCRVTQSTNSETDPDLVTLVHDKELGPLPSGRPAGQPVEVTFSYSKDQVMEVKFVDLASGQVHQDVVGIAEANKPKLNIPNFKIE